MQFINTALKSTRLKCLTAATLCTLLAAPLVAQAHTASRGSINSETLLETERSWDGTLYQPYPEGTPQLSVLKITIEPNTTMDWHQHRVPNAAYVQSGVLTVENKTTGEKRTLKAGEVLPEMVNSTHRGITGDEGATLIVFYAGKKGIPLSVPAPE